MNVRAWSIGPTVLLCSSQNPVTIKILWLPNDLLDSRQPTQSSSLTLIQFCFGFLLGTNPSWVFIEETMPNNIRLGRPTRKVKGWISSFLVAASALSSPWSFGRSTTESAKAAFSSTGPLEAPTLLTTVLCQAPLDVPPSSNAFSTILLNGLLRGCVILQFLLVTIQEPLISMDTDAVIVIRPNTLHT